MTSRGNPSVSPPAQTSQQRHVNTISSSTPPPQPFYPGAPSLHQVPCEFLPQAQSQSFRSYQAYGSAVNDTRGQPANTGRGGPPQPSLPQGAAGFYQQPVVANMRPQQAQQGHAASPQFYLSSQTPAGHYSRPPHPQSSQQVMLISQPYPSANSVIMYQSPAGPLFQPNPFPATTFQQNVMYYPNAWRAPITPAATPIVQPQRAKKVLSIMDPQTGRDITEELLSGRPKSTETEEHHEDVLPANQGDKDICQTFTRLVADRLKDETNTSTDSQNSVSGVVPAGSTASIPSSQYQQPPPQQPQAPSIAPSPMMRPPLGGPPPHHVIRPGMMPQPPATPPHDIQHQMLNVNLSMPPPQFNVRQQAPLMYTNPAQQPHLLHHTSQHLPQQQQSIRSLHMVPAQPHHPAVAHVPSSSTVSDPVPQSPKAETSVPNIESASQDNIPAKPTGPLAQPSSPIQESSPAELPSQEFTDTVTSTMKAEAVSEEAQIHPKAEDPTKEEATQGGVTHSANKDGRKGRKNKKDLNRKDIGGSDMDAFIDKVDSANIGTGETCRTRTSKALASEYGASAVGTLTATDDGEEKQETVSKEVDSDNIQDTHTYEFSAELNTVPLENGYAKDEDNPSPLQSQEQQKQDTAYLQAQKDALYVEAKPPLPQPPADSKISLDKSTAHISNMPSPANPSTQETLKMTNKVPHSPATANAIHTSKSDVGEKAVISQQTTTSATFPISNTATSKNQNAQAGSTRRMSGQSERQNLKPLDNCVSENIHSEPLPTTAPSDLIANVSKASHHVYSDENEPPKDLVGKQKIENIKKVQLPSPGAEIDETTAQVLSDKLANRFRKDGKLHYDRSYLMELRECVTSQTKPEGLPDLEIILDKPVINASRGTSSTPLDFTPAFFQPSGPGRPQVGKTNSRSRPRSDVQMPQRIIKSVSLQDSVKPLHQSEKPWKPSPKQLSSGELTEKGKSLEGEILFIMNRLTPTNFERLAQEMRKLNITTYEDLQELVRIFFDKVTMETKFVEAYANLCKVMSALRVQLPPNAVVKENQATFRVVMLTKCQQEFEADKTVVFEDPEEKRKKIEAEMPDSPERTTLIENTLYQMKLQRLKFYGNIRFIGELFKLNMLTENIMHDCIFRLLKAKDDDSLVSLCNLITTVGQILDTDKAKTRMDQYFAQMAKIAEERKSRIKFTLKDAIDLRSNNWVPRKEQTGPKKIDEVHKDFQDEQATKQYLQSQPLPPRNDASQSSSRRGSRQRQDENKTAEDGWNTVGSKPFRIDATKMKLSKNVVDENNIQLGPGGGMKQFSMWSRGSYGGGAQPNQENDNRPAQPANRFSALRGEEDHRSFQRSPSRGEGPPNRGSRQGPSAGYGRGKALARSSQEGERSEALASARSIVGGRQQSRDNQENHRQSIGARGSVEGVNTMTRSADALSLPSSISPALAGATASGFDSQLTLKRVKSLSEDEMQLKAKTILEEYLSARDLEEAKLCLMELQGQEHLHLLVSTCINETLERTSKERDLTGSFFHELIIHGQLAIDVYIKGLSEILQSAEDILIDIPMIWTYLAEVTVPLLLGGSLPWAVLPAVLRPNLEDRFCARLIADILLRAKERTSEEEVAMLWQSNNFDWKTFIPEEEVSGFLKERKVEFTVGPISKTISRVAKHGQTELQKGLDVDLQRVLAEVEQLAKLGEKEKGIRICAFVDARIPVEKQDKHFIRALVTAIVNASIPASTKKLNEDLLKSNTGVLQQYIKNNPELELQALYAIQSLMHRLEHPSGVIAMIFDTLYDDEVVSEETFKLWEKSTDPQELEGKGACSMQLTQFFTWLRENEETEAS